MTVNDWLKKENENVTVKDIVKDLNDLIDNAKDMYQGHLDEEYDGDYGNEAEDPWIQDILCLTKAIKLIKTTVEYNVLPQYKFNCRIETEDYLYGYSGFFEEDILINKDNDNLYQIRRIPNDIFAIVVACKQYKGNEDKENCGFQLPIAMINHDYPEKEFVDMVYETVQSFEQNNKQYMLKQLEYFNYNN